MFESIDSSEGKNRVFVVSSPSCFLIARAKHLIQAVDPPFLDCLKCKDNNSVLLVIESKTVMTVGRDIVGPNFSSIKSLKSLKGMLGKEANSGLARTGGMNNNASGNGAPNEVKTIRYHIIISLNQKVLTKNPRPSASQKIKIL